MAVFRTRRRIEFVDTDQGGIVHFSRFFVFMETAEHLFLESLGTSVHLEHEGRTIGWPRVSSTCEYVSPARFGDTIEIEVRIARRGRSSMTYEFVFRREETELATGRMTSVCCELVPGESVRKIPIPDFFAELLDAAAD